MAWRAMLGGLFRAGFFRARGNTEKLASTSVLALRAELASRP
jgi:hypothetical protein